VLVNTTLDVFTDVGTLYVAEAAIFVEDGVDVVDNIKEVLEEAFF
jgi:hypothetical protein